ncbi:MBL fold metallo-hydrolase [Ferrimicrobium sp.]|uniref:MBL fold metallo-hydrolase n=1 Tax=Ferrimicrobium sp. TaxID=2926050 RepID=UPI002608F08A|nr:MBL fold metallo-hydrolase [Ferrimicrobium sp.]
MQTTYTVGDLTIEQFVVGPLENNLYVLTTPSSPEALLIDATAGDDVLFDTLVQRNVTKVIITHGHHDHIGAVAALRQQGMRVMVGEPDASLLDGFDATLVDNELIRFGALNLRIMVTPGHTPGSLCIAPEGYELLFTGDTLFPGGPGATKFPGGDFPTIIESIRRIFATFPAETVIMPGHGASTTIGTQIGSLDEWIARGW